MEGSLAFYILHIPSAGIIRVRLYGSMMVITLCDQKHLLSLVPQAPRHY
jgi:hypothetical protein